MKTLTLEEIDAILAKRLATQQGGKGKIIRETMRNLARRGYVTLGSGFGRRVTVTATL